MNWLNPMLPDRVARVRVWVWVCGMWYISWHVVNFRPKGRPRIRQRGGLKWAGIC